MVIEQLAPPDQTGILVEAREADSVGKAVSPLTADEQAAVFVEGEADGVDQSLERDGLHAFQVVPDGGVEPPDVLDVSLPIHDPCQTAVFRRVTLQVVPAATHEDQLIAGARVASNGGPG